MSFKDSASNGPFLYPFDPASPLFVLKGILATGSFLPKWCDFYSETSPITTGTFGAVTGASIGALQSKNPYTLGTNMAINMSIAGLAFFSENFVLRLALCNCLTENISC